MLVYAYNEQGLGMGTDFMIRFNSDSKALNLNQYDTDSFRNISGTCEFFLKNKQTKKL